MRCSASQTICTVSESAPHEPSAQAGAAFSEMLVRLAFRPLAQPLQHIAELGDEYSGQQIAFRVEAPQQAHKNHASAGRIAGHAKSGGNEGCNHLFEGGRIISRRLFTPVQQNQAFLIGRHRPPENHRLEQRLFGMEMVVHGGQIHFRFGDDAAQRSSRVALLGK